jgi:signal transduction histidine kinase
MHLAAPILFEDKLVGAIYLSQPLRDVTVVLRDLRARWLLATAVALVLSGVVGLLLSGAIARPVRRLTTAAGAVARGDLDQQVPVRSRDDLGRLSRAFNDMTARLRAARQMQTDFVADVSHELRTPLTAIKGLLVNLIDAAGPGERPSLDLAERETDRLIRLVNQLLDFSRWQAGRLELNRHPVEVGAVARAAVTLSEGRAGHRGVTLKADIRPGLPAILADPDRLQQVILNLLDNAIKFTPSGGQVTLTAAGCEEGVKVCVQDTGRGMSQEEQEQAFEAYYRGAGGGSGLGLTIARAIVDAHGGQMGLESDSKQGSLVWFTLPVRRDA